MNIMISLGTIRPANGSSGGAISDGINRETKIVGFIIITIPPKSIPTNIIKGRVDFMLQVQKSSVLSIFAILADMKNFIYI